MAKKFQQHVKLNITNINKELSIYVDKTIWKSLPFNFELEDGEPGFRYYWDDNTQDFAQSSEHICGYDDTYKINLKSGSLTIGYTVIIIDNFHLYDTNENKYIDPGLRIFIDSTEIEEKYQGYGISKLFTYFHVSLTQYLPVGADIVSWDQARLDEHPIHRYTKYGFKEYNDAEHVSMYGADLDVEKISIEDETEFEAVNNILFFKDAPAAHKKLCESINTLFVNLLAQELEDHAKGMDFYSKYLQFKTKYIILKNLNLKN
jgi:hypothetical protein